MLYAGTDGGLYKSLDGGDHWAATDGPLTGQSVTSLVFDPWTDRLRYAGTSQGGVYRSEDEGATWQAFNEGLSNVAVTSLAIDRNGHLYAGTSGGGVFETVTSPISSEPCVPDPATLCLLNGRFRVQLSVTDSSSQRHVPGRAIPGGDRFGSFSLPGFTGDPELPEVVVKMVDATATPWRSFWFFRTSLTSLPYSLTVVDTITGNTRSYSGGGTCGDADTEAFPLDPATTVMGDPKDLAVDADSLELLSGRFRVTLTATDPHTGQSITDAPIIGNDRFGYFSLPAISGDPSFPEVVVKMVDGRSVTGAFWFFAASLTDLSYTITVTDATTGSTRTYTNNSAFCGVFDTSSFADRPPSGDLGNLQ